jgi:RimJ/RimL family protein N-acetyltransferase
MLIREVKPEEAEAFINLIKQVEKESHFMLMEAGERKTTPEQQRRRLERMDQQTNSAIFVAEKEDRLVGYLMAIGGSVKRTRHSAYLVIGILEQYRGQKIGTALFQRVEEWAKTNSILRLELTVVTKNEAGVALYKKSGFEIEGTKRHSLMIDGTLFNEYNMSKLL